MNTNNPKTAIVITKRIPAGGYDRVDADGDFYRVISANVEFELARTGTGFLPVQQGDSEEMPPGQNFHRIDLRNPATNGTELVVRLYVGYGRSSQDRQSVMETPTGIIGRSVDKVNANTDVLFDGVAVGDQVRRKSIVISNLDIASYLVVKDETLNRCCVVFPNTSITLPVSGPVYICNETASDITAYISEVFYTVR